MVIVVEAAKAAGSQSSDAFWFSGINFKHIDQKRRWVRHCWTNWLRRGLHQLPRLLLQVHSLSLRLQSQSWNCFMTIAVRGSRSCLQKLSS